ncbi:MAG: ribosome assembly cofactor RimP [Mariprofundaceae bacterium]|nr:ribosome assembly cofactor RimP [Mariprofundaceae bacterium]
MNAELNEHGLECRIQKLLEPIVQDDLIEILKIHIGSGGYIQSLRVVLDRRGGIETGELERISRALSLQLDVENFFRGEFRLELSSPGLDWAFKTDADFKRYLDAWIRLDFHDGKAIEGCNLGLNDGFVQIQEKKKTPASYPLSVLRKVSRAIDWASVSQRGK